MSSYDDDDADDDDNSDDDDDDEDIDDEVCLFRNCNQIHISQYLYVLLLTIACYCIV